MNKKIILLIIILLLSIFMMGSVNASNNTKDNVLCHSSNSDGVDNPLKHENKKINENKHVSSSSEKINTSSKANNKEILKDSPSNFEDLNDDLKDKKTYKLSKNYTYDSYNDYEFTEGITLTKPITIDGNGFTINGLNSARAFNIKTNNVTLKNITFLNCYGEYNSGALYWTGSNGVLNNCKFNKCTSDYNGGAIEWNGANGVVSNCEFNRCSADSNGGAIEWNGANGTLNTCKFNTCDSISGGALYWNGASGVVSNCEFNTCTSCFSGIICWTGNNGKLTNSKFIKCSNSISEGGALYWTGTNGFISNCEFNTCSADSNGGAVYWTGTNGKIINSKFIKCSSKEDGGAVYGVNTLINCEFNNCKAKNGGALYDGTAINCTFNNNNASSAGGAIYGSDCNITDCIFINNQCKNQGGAIYIDYPDTAWISNCVFKNNLAKKGNAIYGGNALNNDFKDNLNPYYATTDFSTPDIKITQSGSYYQNKTITVTLTDKKCGAPLNNKDINIKFSNKKTITIKTNNKGIATYNIPFEPNTYSANISYSDGYTYTINIDNIKISKLPATIIPNKVSTTYNSNKYFQVKVIDSNTKKALSDIQLTLKIYTGKKYIIALINTNTQGIVEYSTSKLNVGTHNITINVNDTIYEGFNSSSVKISKIPSTIIPNKISTTYNSNKYFQVKVIDSNTKKALSDIQLTLKIYTGKKYTTETIKTNTQGIAKYPTSKLNVGTHKITINVKDTKCYDAKSKNSFIKISKIPTTIIPNKISTTYNSNKYFQVKLTNSKTKKSLKNVKVTLKIYTGKKYTTETIKTNTQGIAKYPTSKLNVGTHKITINVKDTKCYDAKSKNSFIKISKIPATIIPTKLSTTYNSNEHFQVELFDSKTKKSLNDIQLTLKIFTGKKYQIRTIKTNSQGIAEYSTSKLSVGTHKIIINIKDAIYTGSSSSSVKISEIPVHIYEYGKYKFSITEKQYEKLKNSKKARVVAKTIGKYKYKWIENYYKGKYLGKTKEKVTGDIFYDKNWNGYILCVGAGVLIGEKKIKL